jgi:PrcB C-terminal
MKVGLTITLGALVAVFLAFAINAEEEKKSDKKEEEEEREVIVNYEIIEQGTYSGKKDSMAQLITNQKDWESLWKEHVSVLVPQPPVPEIDFETHVLAVIFAGEKKSGGYAVVIKDVSVEADDVIVKYRLTEPQPNSFNIQVITQPFAVLKIEKPKGTVRLVKE